MHAIHRYHMQGVQKGDPLLFAKAPKLFKPCCKLPKGNGEPHGNSH